MDASLEEEDTKSKECNITIDEVETALNNTRNNKAAGPDDLCIELIKNATTQTL